MEPTEEELEEVWGGLSGELCSLLQGHGEVPQNLVPFDPLMEVDDDTHKYEHVQTFPALN